MMNGLPLVSIICLCHNHKDYVNSAIYSVLIQTYKRIELIVVDDGSTDGSKEIILEAISDKPNIQFIDIPTSVGNCQAFNRAFHQSKGAYIVDLAADDLLLAKRVEEGINDFANADEKSGVHFSDAFICDSSGQIIKTFYKRNENGQIINVPPQGHIFEPIIRNYFICPPTMMIKRATLEELKGYDENLSYEDFDFWIRSSRNWLYIFNRATLMKKRELNSGLGMQQRKWKNKHAKSTFKVCEKALKLCISHKEFTALIWRIKYEIKHCILTGNLSLVKGYIKLLKQAKNQRRLSSPSSIDK